MQYLDVSQGHYAEWEKSISNCHMQSLSMWHSWNDKIIDTENRWVVARSAEQGKGIKRYGMRETFAGMEELCLLLCEGYAALPIPLVWLSPVAPTYLAASTSCRKHLPCSLTASPTSSLPNLSLFDTHNKMPCDPFSITYSFWRSPPLRRRQEGQLHSPLKAPLFPVSEKSMGQGFMLTPPLCSSFGMPNQPWVCSRAHAVVPTPRPIWTQRKCGCSSGVKTQSPTWRGAELEEERFMAWG